MPPHWREYTGASRLPTETAESCAALAPQLVYTLAAIRLSPDSGAR
jgi:hypothetical protein